jgi:hypothetical protein
VERSETPALGERGEAGVPGALRAVTPAYIALRAVTASYSALRTVTSSLQLPQPAL